MGGDPQGLRVLEALRHDASQRVPEGSGPLERAGLLRLPAEQDKALEIAAAPAPAAVPPPALRPEQVPFLLGIEVPELDAATALASAPR